MPFSSPKRKRSEMKGGALKSSEVHVLAPSIIQSDSATAADDNDFRDNLSRFVDTIAACNSGPSSPVCELKSYDSEQNSSIKFPSSSSPKLRISNEVLCASSIPFPDESSGGMRCSPPQVGERNKGGYSWKSIFHSSFFAYISMYYLINA